MGDGRAEASSAVDGEQAAISLTPDGKCSGSFWMAAPTFVYHSTLMACTSETNSASSNKENSLATFPALWISLVLQLLLLVFCPFSEPSIPGDSQQHQLCHCCFYVSSWYSELEIKILYYCTLYSTVSKVHKSVTTCRGCMPVTMYARHVNYEMTWEHILAFLNVHNLKVSI